MENFFNIQIKEHNFVLSSTKTLFWKNKSTLLLSDLHLGKTENFINNHIQSTYNINLDLQNLQRAIKQFNIKRVIILGDLFHARTIVDKESFKKFLKDLKLRIVLVLGNHDILDVNEYLNLGIDEVYNTYSEDMFYFSHKPEENDLFNIYGHLHPGVQLKGIANQKLKLACFYQKGESFCLPAFGGLTGKHIVIPSKNSQVYIITEGGVIKTDY